MAESENGRYGLRRSFKCEICENETIAISLIPQCMVCSKELCNDCNNYGLCPEHFKKLSSDDQNYITENHKKIASDAKKVKFLTYLSLFLIMTSLIPVFSGGQYNYLLFFVVLLCVVFVLFSIIVFLAMKRTRFVKEVNLEVKNKIKNYNFL